LNGNTLEKAQAILNLIRLFLFTYFNKRTPMTKNILMAILLVGTLGCKKKIEFSDDDTNLYKWKRDLYTAPVQKDEPALFISRTGGSTWSEKSGKFISSDVVVLTEYRQDKQQDSIFKASGQMQVYQYEKLGRVEK
jgi:hypothetical protein